LANEEDAGIGRARPFCSIEQKGPHLLAIQNQGDGVSLDGKAETMPPENQNRH
jgi:hypothetical protein